MLHNNEVLRYILVGTFNTLTGYAIIASLFYVGFIPELSNFIGYFIVIFISYFLNKKYIFRSKDSHKKNFPRFISSMLIAYLLNLLTFEICHRILSLNIYSSQIYAIIVYTVTGYFLLKIWVFKLRNIDKLLLVKLNK
jgi:putative flippase GtrA